jgi:hypothetical protein
VPRRRCDLFDLRICFGSGHPPRTVWPLSSVYQRDVDEAVHSGQAIALDAAGELHVRFRDLTRGLAYGVRWSE